MKCKVSTGKIATPSGAAACVAHLPSSGRVVFEWGDSSHLLVRRKVAQTKRWRPYVVCGAGVAASARRFELGETHGEHRPVRHAERRRGVYCAPASERPRQRRVGRLVASARTEGYCSNEDVASLGYVWNGHNRERMAV